MLSYPSANRDEDVFEEPFFFKANRTPNPQIGFGYGPHICLGQHLGRLEMRIFFEEFFRRVNSVELTGLVERSRSINVSRSEEHTSELQSLMRISYAVFFLKKTSNI